jgi:hypothetical protein
VIATFKEISFSDEDVVNADGFIPAGESNPHNVRPWLLSDHGFIVAIVFADCLQDALDVAADSGRLDRFAVAEQDMTDYQDGERLAFLGNASEPFDIDSLDATELPNPPFSFVALFNNAQL